MTVTVKLFALYRDIVGSGDLTVKLDNGAVVADVIHQLESQYPFEGKLEELTMTAVNETYVHRKKALRPDDVVALFPPVSGG